MRRNQGGKGRLVSLLGFAKLVFLQIRQRVDILKKSMVNASKRMDSLQQQTTPSSRVLHSFRTFFCSLKMWHESCRETKKSPRQGPERLFSRLLRYRNGFKRKSVAGPRS